MQARSYVKGIQMSPRRMRAVANTVRGEKVQDALNALQFMPKKAARFIEKALVSAASNAEDLSGGDVVIDNLKVHTICIDGGSMMKRWMPRAMGRANRINHRTSHLTVVVSDEE